MIIKMLFYDLKNFIIFIIILIKIHILYICMYEKIKNKINKSFKNEF